eukprot:3934296-Rhodomonas_salina.2
MMGGFAGGRTSMPVRGGAPRTGAQRPPCSLCSSSNSRLTCTPPARLSLRLQDAPEHPRQEHATRAVPEGLEGHLRLG